MMKRELIEFLDKYLIFRGMALSLRVIIFLFFRVGAARWLKFGLIIISSSQDSNISSARFSD